MINIEIIVARYNEDLSWLLEYPFNNFQYTVYNKGDNDNFEKKGVLKIINLPNVGREVHTYLYHIIENYHNLSNVTVFFPGSLNLERKKTKCIQILNNIIKSNYTNAYFIGQRVKNIKTHFDKFTINNWQSTDSQNSSKNSESKLQLCKIRPFGKWHDFFFGNVKTHWISMCGIFSINKRDIRQHSIKKYKLLLQTVSKHSSPEAVHYIERAWGSVFHPLNHTLKIIE
jgi:hypothetical protein